MKSTFCLPLLCLLAAAGIHTGCDNTYGTGNQNDAAVQRDAASGIDGARVDAAPAPDAAPTDSGSPDPDADTPDASTGPDATTGPDGGTTTLGCIQGSFTPYYGNFHAHTSNSDGTGNPAQAFDHARNVGLVDIQWITDHLEQLYDLLGQDSGEYDDCQTAADAANVPGTFLAMCGYEYGSGFGISGSTGHNNVFWEDTLFPQIQLNFHDFYQSVISCTGCITQYNHPGDESSQTWNDWEFDALVDVKMNLFEFNGGGSTWNLFFDALDAGWHLSPMYNQDNHSDDWGSKNDRRSGFYLTDLTRASLYQAMAERRSFMTMDKNATLHIMGDTTCWMGSILSGFASLTVDASATDPDSGDGFTSIELYGPGQALVHTIPCGDQTACGDTYTLTVSSATYIVARATQSDGDYLVSAPIWVSP